MTCKNYSKKCSEDVCYCPQYDFSEVKGRADREDSLSPEDNLPREWAKKLAFNKRYGRQIELSDIKPPLTTEQATEEIRKFFTQVFNR